MLHRSRILFSLAVAGVVALGCSGRTTNGSDANNLPDGVSSDEVNSPGDSGKELPGSDTPVPSDTPTTEYTGPVADAIKPIQESDSSVKCPPEGTTETPAFVNGAEDLALDVVVVSPRYIVSKDKTTGEPTKYGYFVADAGLTQSEAWRGIAITVATEVTTEEWVPGDALTLTADHVEYYCFSQVAVTAATRKGTLPIPAPLDIEAADLGSQDAALAEKYEGVLVRVRNVTVVTTPALGTDGKDHGSFLADDDLIVANDFKVPYMSTGTDARKVGDTFDSIVGVVKYSFDQYILVPRSAADMVLGGTQPGDNTPEPTDDVPVSQDLVETVNPTDTLEEADAPNPTDTVVPGDAPAEYIGPVAEAIRPIQESDISVKCPPDGAAETPQFVNGAKDLALDVVVMSPRYVVTANKKYGYIVADAGLTQSEAWRGIAITVPVEVTTDEWVPGDALTLTADHVEYYCFSQVAVTAATRTGTLPIPAPLEIEAADLGGQDSAVAEKLEGVLVRVRNVTVVTASVPGTDGKDHGSFGVDDDLIVANDFKVPYMNKATDERTVGDRFDSIVGVVKYSFDQYVLAPRSAADMVLAGTQPADPTPEATEDIPVTPDTIVTPDAVEPAPEVVEPSPEIPEVVEPAPEVVEPSPEIPEVAEPSPEIPEVVEPSPEVPEVVEPSPEIPEVTDPGTEVVAPGLKVVDLQGGEDSESCTTGENNGTPQYGITMAPVVVTSPQFSATATLHGYYVADESSASTDSGMTLLVAKSLGTAFVPGDKLAVTGDYKEYFCMTEVVVLASATAPATVGTVTRIGTATVPAPIVLQASVLQNGGGAAAEPYEGMIVTVENVAVSSLASSDGKGWFRVGTGIEVSSDFFYPVATAPYTPVLNQDLASLTGALKFHYGKYRIVPRTAADFVVAP